MIDYRKIQVCVLFVTALLSAAGEYARGSVLPEKMVDHKVEGKAVQLMHELEKQGFEVSRGYFKLWTIDECEYTSQIMGTCYGNNPAAPYVISTLPPWPGEFVDPDKSNLWGPSQEGYHDIYRFDPREAIVILGLLPPPGAYFSEQTWLFTRQETLDTTNQTYQDIYNSDLLRPFLPLFFATDPRYPERTQVLSSLSNIINNVVIERQSGAAFNQIRYFIITPDQFMDKAVRKAFTRIPVKDEDVFTESIPSDMNIGLDQSSDDFTTRFRFAHPRDGGMPGTPSDTWRKDLPLVVLRVRDTPFGHTPETYPPVVLETRTAIDEWPLEPDLGNLLAAVSRRWGQPCATADCSDRAGAFIDLQTGPAKLMGPSCTDIGENCLLDTLDASYQLYGPRSLDNGEIYAVSGTLGTETGNATYVGLGINQVSMLKGIADLSGTDLRGTASAYAGEVNNTDKFYLYYFTRDCSGLEDLTDGNCLSLKDLIPPDDQLAISIRDYIKPGTQRGPDSQYVLPSKVLKLERP